MYGIIASTARAQDLSSDASSMVMDIGSIFSSVDLHDIGGSAGYHVQWQRGFFWLLASHSFLVLASLIFVGLIVKPLGCFREFKCFSYSLQVWFPFGLFSIDVLSTGKSLI
jgi:hypothetical protein